MKKAKTIGKKTLSVFLAVLMVLTAWVWVAPTEAEAAAGTYYVRVYYNLVDRGALNPFIGDTAVDYTGPTMTTASAGVTLYHKANNGTASGDPVATNYNMKSLMFDDDGTDNLTINNHIAFSGVGFPTEMQFFAKCGTSNYGEWYFTKITVAASSSATEHTLWEGKVGCQYGGNPWQGTINTSGFTSNRKGSGTWTTTSDASKWIYPYANTFTWSPTTLSAMTCPKTASDSAATQTVAVTAKDQYGVQMFDPTWSVKGSNKSDGITVSPATGGSTTISVTSSANIAGTTNSQTGTVTATWTGTNAAGTSIAKTSSKSFTINDATYNATFTGHRNVDGVVQNAHNTTAQYGVTPTAPTASDYSEGDYDYTFTGWNPTLTGISTDTTYTAVYSQSDPVPADYTAVNEALAAVNELKAEYGSEFELKYTHASRTALDSAVNAVVTGLGRTQQTTVDGYAQAINDAIAGLEPNKFDVIFLDKDGAILLYEKDVEYKESVTAPTYSAKYYDSTNHYTFTGWDTNEYTSVVDDLVIQPVFVAEGHIFTTETVPSTCVQKGATKYTCSCGYSYIDGESDYGDHVWETEFTTDLEPTCTVAGSKSTHCSLCDAQKDITVIPPLGHNFTSQSVAVEATCGKIGIVTKVCDDCLYCEHTIIPALEHDYKETVVAPTCTTKGYTEYVCQRANCGHSYRDNYTDVVAHSYGAWETVSEAYCGVAGVKKQTCTECGHVNIGSIDALQHNLSGWTTVVDRTCTGKGYQVKTCSLCNNVIEEQWLDALGHNYVEKTVVKPTCTSKGYTIEECNRTDCGAQRIVNETPALNHAWTSTTHAADCTHSAYIEHICGNDSTHNYVEYVSGSTVEVHTWVVTETTNETCTTDGLIKSECSVCGETKEEILPRTGHNYGAWQVVKEATNTEDGQWKRVCANNAEHIEYITIPKGGHTWDNGTVTKTANCTTTGTMVYKCTAHTDCGITLEVTVPVTQHTIAQKVTDATCTSTGTVEAYCSVCDANCENPFSTQEIPVKAHVYTAGTAVAPTCTTSGYTPYTCACGASYKKYDETKPATGHTYTSAVTKDASCTEEGVKTFTCSCGASYTETIPATGHTYVKGTVTAANCTTAGTEVYTCSCGDTYTKFIEAAKGHTYENWEVITPATADKSGVQMGTCACGDVKYDVLPPIGNHTFTETITKNPTCTEKGEKSFTCSAHTDCSANYTAEIPALGHTQKIVYTAPTCIASGSSKIVCETCDETIKTETIPAIGYHNFSGEGTVTAEPTCTGTGTMTYTCATDGCTAKKIETIPAKGHDLKTTVTDAKCGEKGSVVTTCSRCTYSDTTELAAKGHIWKDTPESTVDADCENNGSETYKCQKCDAENVVVIPKLGHDWSEWTVTPSTNNDKGSVSRTCKREGCTVTETVDIPAGGHELVVDTDKSTAANCTTEGKTVYKCKNHADCGITVTVTVPEKGHTNVVETTQATCTVDGSIVEKCGVCGVVHKTTTIPAKGHTTTVTTTPATCTQEGSVVEYCENCKTTLKTTTIEKLQHDYSGTETVTKEATCTEDGSKTVQCKTCEDTTTVVVPHTGHTWGEWNVTTPATNTTAGEMTRTCSNGTCTETVVIPAGGHTWDNGTVKEEATCTETGTMVYKCNNPAHTDCGVTLEVTIPVKQHTIVQKIEEASCTKKGSVKAYCSVCDANCENPFSTQEIPVKAHVYTAGAAVAPTCTTSGYTPYTCACGDTYNEYDETKPATGHDLVEGASTATCVGAGEMTLNCNNSNCNYSTTVDVPALGHNYVENAAKATEATCAAAATKTYECSRCESNYTVSVGEKSAEHTWGAWQVKESATATSLGYKTSTCEVCGQIKVETIPATGEHNFNDETSRTEATCTTDGSVTYACSTHTNCGLTSTVTLPATGHTEAHDYKAATCTEAGYSRMVCSVESCKEVLAKTEIPALGHLYGEGTVTNATCKDTGKIEYTCTRTGCTATHETVIATNSNAHQYVTVVTDSTCTVKGSVVTKCALCGNVTTNKELPVIEHSWNSGEVKEGDAATCTADGTKTFACTVCSATKTETIAKLGHVWGEWTETKASTNTEKGTLTRTCSRGCTETAEIPAGGHAFGDVPDSTTPATCTATGTATYNCTAHTGENACGITVTVTLDKIQHEFETTKKDATCEGTGTVVTKCKNCDTATITTEIPATGHTYNDGVKTDATCTSEGKIVYTCTADKCGKTKEVTLDKLQHNYVAGDPVAATCTSSGYTPYECSCGSAYVRIDSAANGHTYTEKLSSTAKCTEAGTLTLKCKDCTATMTTDVPALGHDYKLNGTTTATCKDAATETYKCSRCESNYTVSVGAKTENHNMTWETVAATNTSLGYKLGTCSVCGKVEVEIIPATGEHVFDELDENKSYAATCEADGLKVYNCSKHENCTETSSVVIPKLGHTEQLIYSAATCTKKGSTSIYCDVCKTTLDSEEIPALDHVWGNEVITQPTCSSTGSIVFTCTSCNTATKTVTIPENENAHQLTKDVKLATCKEAGYVKAICENTDCKYVVETELPMLQHSWGDWIVKPSTNNAAGSVSRTCSNGCTESVEIPAGGHNFGNTPDSVVAATCTATGTATYNCIAHTGENTCGVTVTVTLEKVQHALVTESETATCEKGGFVKVYCSNCDYKPVDMTIGKLAHNDEIIETVPATCETAGYTTFKCKDCGRGFSRLDAQPTGHKYINDGAIVTTPATCETAGYTTYNCDNCDETHVDDVAAAKGHDWTEWSVTKAATNTEPGELSRTCKNGCGEKETAEIPAGGHSFNTAEPSATTDGTCLVKGTKTFKCSAHSDCGVTITVETEFGAHAWSDWTKVDATNDTDGSWTRECSVCHTKEAHIIPKGDHKFGDTPSSTVPATCKKTGTATYNCTTHTNCGVTITVVLEMIQHTAGVDKKDATCTENGYVKTYCTACGEVISNVELEKTGHVETTTERKESTCIEKGYEKVVCKCGELISEKELPLTDHNYEVTYENGVYTYTCKQEGCGHTYTETVDISFTVRFFAADKKTVIKTEKVTLNGNATAPEAPAKAADENYHYTFSEWDRDFSNITADLDVYPLYEKEAHYGGEATCKDKPVCDKCNTAYGETDASKHIMATKVTPATCENDGSLLHYCSVNGCDYSYSEVINKLGHNFGAWETYQNGNCTTPYITIRKCQNYGCEEYEKQEKYGSHTWYTQPEIAPTCTTEGYSAYKYCVTCGVEIESVVIPKLDHKDANGDGMCDYCTHTEAAPSCSCMCHSTGFMKFIYSIVRFFWMITKSTPTCSCGAHHY